MTAISAASSAAFLRPPDEELFARMGIDADLLHRAGIRRVTDAEARVLLAQPRHHGDLAGVFIPYVDPVTGQRVTGRLRRDNPEIEGGKPKAKYLAAYGDHPHVFFAPGVSGLLEDVTATAVLVEAEKSALACFAAATRQGRRALPIALGGCWGWRTQRAGKAPGLNGGTVNEAGVQPDLERVRWSGRDAVILFDSNAATNPKVRSARRQLAAELQSRGARIRIGTVPAEPGVNGPDDYRALHDDASLFTLIDQAVPVQPPTVDDVLEDCGFSALTSPIDLSVLERALRELADLLRSADPIRKGLARTAAVGRLKALKVDGAASLVDAALGVIAKAAEDGPALVREDDPWPDEVSGGEVLDTIVHILRRYLVLPPHADVATALWIAHAYAMAAWSISPLLVALSPVKRCGKTTTLMVVGALSPKPLHVSNVTAAVLFRVIEDCAPTLLSDEADTWLSDETSELRGIFNAGHTRGAAFVARCVGDDHEVKLFSVWAPKVIAMIGRPPDTIEDRSILIELRRKAAEEQVARLRLDRIDAEALPIRRQLKRWAQDHLEELRASDPQLPAALHDRSQDNWRPLVAVAEVAGGKWPERARTAALALSGQETAEDVGAELLMDIRNIFTETHDPPAISSADLLEALVKLEDRPWAEWSKGKPLSGAKLARLLKPFKVLAAGSIRIGDRTARGYRREAFNDAWTRYLPEIPRSKECQRDNANNHGPKAATSRRDTDSDRHTLKHPDCTDNDGSCHAVTLSSPDSGEEEEDRGLF